MDHMKEEAKAKYNEAVGNMTNDQSQVAKGHAEDAKADAENKADEATDTVKQSVSSDS
jgi:uncharacterized protein YjbJ (UPF0337 family)